MQCSHSGPVLVPAPVPFHIACLTASLSTVQATIPGSSLHMLHVLAVRFGFSVPRSLPPNQSWIEAWTGLGWTLIYRSRLEI